nr:MAG TPA: hypothetical protein [Caudoviricetes sp.]
MVTPKQKILRISRTNEELIYQRFQNLITRSKSKP